MKAYFPIACPQMIARARHLREPRAQRSRVTEAPEQGLGCGGKALDVARGADQRVVGGARPAGLVVSAVGHPEVEKGVGIDVVADPSGAGDVVVERPRRSLIRLPLLVVGDDREPEMAA